MWEFAAYPLLALVFVGIFSREVIAPASRNHCDRRWLLMSSALACSTLLVTLLVGHWFSDSIRAVALFDVGQRWPAPLVGLASFGLTSFVFYWWHRATHRWDLLWRVFHQLHHSAPRVEALTAFYAHPMDTAAAVLLSALSSYWVLGASPLAAAFAIGLTGAFDLFLHADIRTPRWVGYLVQRPEMHTVHHQHGHHAQNYGLPIWDLLFGTWANPPERVQRLGFDDEKAARISDMLRWQDVHKKR
ncbi:MULTISPECIES: sterol desaturase family protein [Comamonas]|jgi:sterol desaturase/sphingolipid hydroxylase (fatty acid hydroxylase superfamily)|uniref:sterol desaturase family protein n=1 Tax=Comamonas TaxID=283 RepID=UPI002102F148|nr:MULTISPECIES: sterol desaturase family protein [Comamonas]MDH1293561.1 sterol desaturase family protein [Comamonas terrigena]